MRISDMKMVYICESYQKVRARGVKMFVIVRVRVMKVFVIMRVM